MKQKHIIILQEHLPHYRVPFYKKLHELLNAADIRLDLIYDPNTAPNLIKGSLEWAIPVPIRRFGKVAWQPVINIVSDADLVIAPQEMKYLAPLVIQCKRALTGRRFALWGHGRDFQTQDRYSFTERLKSSVSRHAHWWFAYNHLSAQLVKGLGYPGERVTEVMNAIDTDFLIKTRQRVSPEQLIALKKQLGIRSENIGIYTGGLYAEKRLNFLLAAAARIRREIPDFHLIIIGSGPESGIIQNAVCDWIHYPGPKDDEEKIPYWMIAKVLLMPGTVGLVILDSFALGVPLITTAAALHSPEIEYLQNGKTGIIVPAPDLANGYALAVVELLRNPVRLRQIAQQAEEEAKRYTILNMAERFSGGVLKALKAPVYTGFRLLDFLRKTVS